MYTLSLLTLATVALAAPAKVADTVGNVSIFNNCPSDVNFWTAINGDNFSGMNTVPANSQWSESFDPASANHKTFTLMTSTGGPNSQDPKLVLGYTWAQDQGQVYYDLYTVGDSPFAGQSVLERSTEPSCGSNVWPNGTPVDGNHVWSCRTDRDIQLFLCGGSYPLA